MGQEKRGGKLKTCIRCGELLTDENWPKAKRENHINKCLPCIQAEGRVYQKKWCALNKDKVNSALKRYDEKLRLKDPIKRRAMDAYNDCRKRAIRLGMEFDLVSADLIDMMRVNRVCPYFNWDMTYEAGKHKTLASVDRKDSSKGYTKDNIQIISYLANLMKSNANDCELEAFAYGVIRTIEKIKGAA